MNARTPLLVSFCLFLMAANLATPKHKLYVIGDSTLSPYDANLSPRTGWAQVLQDLFVLDSVQVVNKALSGRSSKSFYDEKAWDPVKSSLKSGDYVLIEFGHNDEKTSDAARSTLPGSTFEKYLSIYIDDAKAKGAIPILGTPIERNGWSSATKVKASHVTSDGDYPKAIRDLAAKKGVAVVDMTVLTTALYEKLGKDTTTSRIFMNLKAGDYANYPNGNSDNTHLQLRGAREIAKLFATDIARQKIAPLASWLVGASVSVRREAPSSPAATTAANASVDALGRTRPSRDLAHMVRWNRDAGRGALEGLRQ